MNSLKKTRVYNRIRVLTEALRGETWVKSESGKGTTFSCSIPVSNEKRTIETIVTENLVME